MGRGSEKRVTSNANGKASSLPALDERLSVSISALKENSAQKEAPSMCRLATEYAYCWDLQQQNRQIASQIEAQSVSFNSATSTEIKRDLASSLRSLLTREKINQAALQHCEGVDVPSSETTVQLLRGAALLGHVPSMSLYATGQAFNSSNYLQALESMKTYRGEAKAIAISAASKGDLTSMFALADAYRTPNQYTAWTMLGDAVEDDDIEALAYYYQLEKIYENNARPYADRAKPFISERIEALTNMLSPSSVALARDRAVQRVAKWTLPPIDARAYVAGINSSPSPDMLRAACASHGPSTPSKIYRETLTGEVEELK